MAGTGEFLERVPPMEQLLSCGVPSIAVLDTYIADLDVDLDENAKELDNCLKDMLKLTNQVVGKEYVTPRDALLSMLSTHALEQDTCYDPDSDAITEILSHAAFMLEKVPGSEEAVLQDLLSLSSEQGLSLPLKSSVVDPIASTMSLNAVSDDNEIQISQQWDQIALRLRRYFLDRLSHLPISPRQPELNINDKCRLKYVQSLMTLQPINEVWERYQTMRREQLERCLSMLMPENELEPVDILHISENCFEIAQIIIQMMNEDFIVLSSGMMKKASMIFHAFHRTYLDKYSDEMSALVDEVWDEIRVSQKVSAGGKLSKSKGKSQSNSSLYQSTNSVASGSGVDNPSAGNQRAIIPAKYIKVMINIVTTLQQIEDHVDGLQRASIWDLGGISTKKPLRKGSLKGVLKPSSSPELNKRPNSATMSIDSDSWLSDAMTASYSSATSMLFDGPAQPKVTVVEKMKIEEKIRWNWKFIFKQISGEFALSVEHEIQAALDSSIQAEEKVWATEKSLETVEVKSELYGGRLDYPRYISKATSDFMTEIDNYLILAKAGHDGSLHTVKTAFIDVTNTCLRSLHSHLTKMSTEIPLQSPINNLYVILSSAAYIRNQLLHYDTVLAQDETSKKAFSLQYKEFVELVEALTEGVIQRHNNYIGTSVLHDTDSHNWTETKEFYEGERCSFPIQMWHYYLQGVQSDMWVVCPPKLAQTTLSAIIHDSLQLFTQRYTQAKPSFRRVGQFRSDIMTILLCVSETLFSCSNSISRCIDAGHSQTPHYSIHNLCTALLSAMVVVASPMELLHKVNKKGYRYRQKRKSFQHMERGCNTTWLSWVRPTLFDKSSKRYECMRTTVALYLHTKLLLCQPELSYQLTLQAYLMKDYTLSILFLTQACVGSYSNQSKTAESPDKQPDSSNVEKTFMLSLFRVLLNSSGFTDGLAKVVLPVIDRSQDWACLDARHIPGKDMPIPVWLDCILQCMKPFVLRVVRPVLDYILTHTDLKQITPIASVIEELPCGCRSHATMTTPRTSKKSDGGTMDCVLKLVLGQMAEDMFVLPADLCVLFKCLEQHCADKGMKTTHHCVGIKFVALALREYLLDMPQMCADVGFTLNQAVTEELKLVADCVYHVLVSGKVKGSSTPRLAGRFCKENRDWINDKVQILVFYLNSEIFEDGVNTMLDADSTEFQDQLYLSLVSDITATPEGCSDLRNLYWLLKNNQDWLHRQLDIKHGLMLAHTLPDTDTFMVDMSPKPEPKFNPLTAHQQIGPYKFDHASIENLPIEWEKLLQSDLGLSEIGFSTLLYNRHEMQDGAYLEENEKRPVAGLRAVFENDPRELK